MIGKNLPLRGPLRILLILGGLAVAAILLYQIPAINERFSWRLIIVEAYARGVIDPVKPLPTPRMEQDVVTMQDIFQYFLEGVDENSRAKGRFEASGVRPTFMDRLESLGIRLPGNIFRQRVMMRD